MRIVTLTPAYGRDYSSAEAAKADFFEGKDFILNDIFDKYNGKPINIEQFTPLPATVQIRYHNLTRLAVINLTRSAIEKRFSSGKCKTTELLALSKFLKKFS